MMTQKSNEEIYKSLSEEERNVTVTSVELTDKAFKGKTDYSAIARLNGKVVFREGEYFSTLEGLQLFVFKNGKQITAYNWKIEDGTKNFRILYSTKTDKSGKIFFGLILRGDVPIIVGHTEDIEQETHYELLVHAWDTETGYIWVGDNQDGGLTRIDYHSKSSFDIWDGFRPIRQVWFSLSRASGHFVSCFVSGKKVQ